MDVQVNFLTLVKVHGVNDMVGLVNDQIVIDYPQFYDLVASGDLIGSTMLTIQKYLSEKFHAQLLSRQTQNVFENKIKKGL